VGVVRVHLFSVLDREAVVVSEENEPLAQLTVPLKQELLDAIAASFASALPLSPWQDCQLVESEETPLLAAVYPS
jgi:hypothetical protein